MLNESFPLERIVPFENDSYFAGRLTVHQLKKSYHVEVDIIQKESFKIYRHIGILYNFDDPSDALEMGYRELKLKLSPKDENIP